MSILLIYIYINFFIIGVLFGSFCTLAVYRIPLKQDIFHTRSYCPNCNHRLNFLDLIPIFSYIFLRGKCRYCKQTIRARYLIIEILCGLSFLLCSLKFGINIFVGFNYITTLIFLLLNFIGIFILVGIEKEYKKVQSSVLIYLFFINVLYKLFIGWNYINLIGLVMLLIIIFLKINNFKNINENKIFNILTILVYFLCFNDIKFIAITFLVSVLIKLLILIVSKNKEHELLSFCSILMITFVLSTIFIN